MRKGHILWTLVLTGLVAAQAQAVEFFMPVPYLGGNFVYRTEFLRQDVNKNDVAFSFVAEGRSGVGTPMVQYTVLPGPSTNRFHPLVTDNYARDYRRPDRSDPKYYLPGPGLALLEGEQGLLGVETAVVIGGDPATAWELPLLTEDDAFTAGDTAYVQSLLKTAETSSQLSIYNLGSTSATCTAKLLSAAGAVLDTRANLTVPAVGSLRLADILSKVALPTTGLNASVTCDHPFYTLGSFPAKAIGDIRVHYPTLETPTAGTAVTLVTGGSFRVTKDNPVKYFNLPLETNVLYRSITIDFDVKAASPTNDAYYRGLLGMWRDDPGLRFGKILFFGLNERFDRSKMLVDLGTPYIEIMTKKGNAALAAGKTYHFHIEASSDQRSFQMKITSGALVVANMQSGLFNEDLIKKGENTLIVGFGLPGIGDGAYSPPYGFQFTGITIKGYK